MPSRSCLGAALVLALHAPARASEEEEKRKLEEELQRELEKSAPAPGTETGTGTVTAPAAVALPGATAIPAALAKLLPDISLVGFVGGGASIDAPEPAFGVGELELGIQAVVDPHARFDSFIAFTPEGVEVEEAYLTFLTLPGNLQARLGRFLLPLGRLNAMHGETWATVDMPPALARAIGEEENLGASSLEVSWLAPLPVFVELRGGAGRLDEATALFNGRLTLSFDLGDWVTVLAGGSYAYAQGGTHLYAGDLYVKVRPPWTRAFVALQAEYIGRFHRGDLSGGIYAQVVWRIDRHWALGARYDELELPGSADPDLSGRRANLVATFDPSEFLRFRAQGAARFLPDGTTSYAVLGYAEFSIGPHGAHPF